MRGIEFECQRKKSSILNELFHSIPLWKYHYNITETEIIKDEKAFILPSKMNGEEFKKFISSYPYLIVFLNIKAYFKKDAFSEIRTYEDFLKSSCEFIILISDVSFVEIYAKDDEIMSLFIHNAEKLSDNNIAIKSRINDGRIYLSVT